MDQNEHKFRKTLFFAKLSLAWAKPRFARVSARLKVRKKEFWTHPFWYLEKDTEKVVKKVPKTRQTGPNRRPKIRKCL